jgi:hypothetical protein
MEEPLGAAGARALRGENGDDALAFPANLVTVRAERKFFGPSA